MPQARTKRLGLRTGICAALDDSITRQSGGSIWSMAPYSHSRIKPSVVRRTNVHNIVGTGRRPGPAIGQRTKPCAQLDYPLMAVLKFSRSLKCPKFTPPRERCGSASMRRRSTQPTSMVRNGARAEQQKVDPPPYVPGMEAAGIVDEVGSGVPDRLKVGDAVMAIVVPKGSHGAYREQIALDARSVVRAPAGKTHPEAASLPMNGLTARLSLDLLKLSPGQVIAVTGAAGAYGGYVVQLAKAEGLTVIADASEKDEKLVASLGADVVVRRGDDVASRIRKHFPQGVDGLADGAVLNELVIPAVRDGGAFTSVRGFQGIPQRDIHFTTTFVRSYAQEFEKLDRLRQQVDAGKITLRVAEVYPPERAADAHRRLEAGGTRGRLVIQFYT